MVWAIRFNVRVLGPCVSMIGFHLWGWQSLSVYLATALGVETPTVVNVVA